MNNTCNNFTAVTSFEDFESKVVFHFNNRIYKWFILYNALPTIFKVLIDSLTKFILFFFILRSHILNL